MLVFRGGLPVAYSCGKPLPYGDSPCLIIRSSVASTPAKHVHIIGWFFETSCGRHYIIVLFRPQMGGKSEPGVGSGGPILLFQVVFRSSAQRVGINKLHAYILF